MNQTPLTLIIQKTNERRFKMSKLKNLSYLIIANISFILILIAMIFFVLAAFSINLIVGYVVIGVLLVVLAWILQPQNGGDSN